MKKAKHAGSEGRHAQRRHHRTKRAKGRQLKEGSKNGARRGDTRRHGSGNENRKVTMTTRSNEGGAATGLKRNRKPCSKRQEARNINGIGPSKLNDCPPHSPLSDYAQENVGVANKRRGTNTSKNLGTTIQQLETRCLLVLRKAPQH